MTKLSFTKFLSILWVIFILTACSNSDSLEKSSTKNMTSPKSIEEQLSSVSKNNEYVNFTQNLLDGDTIVFNNCIFTNKSFKQIKENIIVCHYNANNNKIIGQKYIGFSGSDKWMNPIIEYDIQTKKDFAIFKDLEEFKNSVLQGTNGEKLLISVYKDKKERWNIGKEEIIIFDIKLNKSYKIDFQFKKDYPSSAVSIADIYSDGYVISFTSSDEKNPEKTGHFTILTDLKGTTKKFLKLGKNGELKVGIYKNLKISPDESKIIYSLGTTGANLFLYDMNTEKVTCISEESVVYSVWSQNSKSVYYITIQPGENSSIKYFLNRFDI